MKVIGVMLATSMFSLLYGGSLADAVVALFAGLVMSFENY